MPSSQTRTENHPQLPTAAHSNNNTMSIIKIKKTISNPEESIIKIKKKPSNPETHVPEQPPSPKSLTDQSTCSYHTQICLTQKHIDLSSPQICSRPDQNHSLTVPQSRSFSLFLARTDLFSHTNT